MYGYICFRHVHAGRKGRRFQEENVNRFIVDTTNTWMLNGIPQHHSDESALVQLTCIRYHRGYTKMLSWNYIACANEILKINWILVFVLLIIKTQDWFLHHYILSQLEAKWSSDKNNTELIGRCFVFNSMMDWYSCIIIGSLIVARTQEVDDGDDCSTDR